MRDESYFRYTDAKDTFIEQCFQQAQAHSLLMTDIVAEKIWKELQSMNDPENFHFGLAFKKHQLISTK